MKSNIRPVQQIGRTCWFYSIIHIIKHSPILKNNIEYSILKKRKLLMDMKKAKGMTFKKNVCSKSALYYKTLKLIWSSGKNYMTLLNFISKVSRSSVFVEYHERINRGAPENTFIKTFRNLLMRLGLPYNTISPVKKKGYTLVGSIATFDIRSRNGLHNTHAIAGVFDKYSKPLFINSAWPSTYNINWTKNNWENQLYGKWNTTPWMSVNKQNYMGQGDIIKIYARDISV
jgi:hypothetical protein